MALSRRGQRPAAVRRRLISPPCGARTLYMHRVPARRWLSAHLAYSKSTMYFPASRFPRRSSPSRLPFLHHVVVTMRLMSVCLRRHETAKRRGRRWHHRSAIEPRSDAPVPIEPPLSVEALWGPLPGGTTLRWGPVPRGASYHAPRAAASTHMFPRDCSSPMADVHPASSI